MTGEGPRPTRRDGHPAERHLDGWRLAAEGDWFVEGAIPDLDAVVATLPAGVAERWGSVVRLRFGNLVGRVPAGPLGTLHVQSGKWTEDAYDGMLAELTAEASALPFAASTGSSLPYARDPRGAPRDLPYHRFVWLRHALLGAPGLLAALRAIVADPHRRLVREEREVPVELAGDLSPRTLEDAAAGRWPLQRAPRGLGFAGHLPTRVADTMCHPTVDVPENRFVKAFLDDCAACVTALRRTPAPGPLRARIAHDAHAIEAALAPIRRAPLWSEVGRLGMLPTASTVLQRRAAYREVLVASQLLRAPSRALPLDDDEVVRLLEVKNVARLYELWVAFRLVGLVREALGPPTRVEALATGTFDARPLYGLRARWGSGVEVAYNPTYTRNDGWHGRSRSLELRPDAAVFVPAGPYAGLHLFDAKFRVTPDGAPQPDDLHKMHAYRDALPAARSAWAVFPGDRAAVYRDTPGGVGIGGLPLVSGREPVELVAVVRQLVG